MWDLRQQLLLPIQKWQLLFCSIEKRIALWEINQFTIQCSFGRAPSCSLVSCALDHRSRGKWWGHPYCPNTRGVWYTDWEDSIVVVGDLLFTPLSSTTFFWSVHCLRLFCDALFQDCAPFLRRPQFLQLSLLLGNDFMYAEGLDLSVGLINSALLKVHTTT